MIAMTLGAAWAGLVMAAGWHHRPRPARHDLLAPRPAAGAASGPARPGPLEVVGRLLRTGVGRRPAGPPSADRRAGTAMVVLLAGAAVWPPLGLGAAAAAWWGPALRRRAAERRRLAAYQADLPQVVDLLAVAVGAGLTVYAAVEAVARRAAGPLGPPLRRVVDQTRRGRRVADALDGMAAEVGDVVRPLVAALTDSDRYGTPLAAGLEQLASDVRMASRRRVEEAARQVPVKLLFPLVFCILPAFALLTVAPLIAGSIRALRL